MEFCTVRDLRTQPGKVWARLAEKKEIVVTNNGRPNALMIDVTEDNLEDVLTAVRRSLAMQAITRMRLAAHSAGLDKLTEADIQEEITAYRQEGKQ